MQRYCLESGKIENCARLNGNGYTMEDVLEKMATNLTELVTYCENTAITRCTAGCLMSFRTSRNAYLFNVCAFVRIFQWERDCWDSSFVQRATWCYRDHYPQDRTTAMVYPMPFRVYDRHSIARLCFRDVPDRCRYFQSFALLHLMPNYFEIHPYPESFHHVNDFIGFPGYSHSS